MDVYANAVRHSLLQRVAAALVLPGGDAASASPAGVHVPGRRALGGSALGLGLGSGHLRVDTHRPAVTAFRFAVHTVAMFVHPTVRGNVTDAARQVAVYPIAAAQASGFDDDGSAAADDTDAGVDFNELRRVQQVGPSRVWGVAGALLCAVWVRVGAVHGCVAARDDAASFAPAARCPVECDACGTALLHTHSHNCRS